MDVRRPFLLLLLPSLLQTGLGAADPVQRTLRSGGRVEMRLEAGEYDIQPADGELLSVAVSGPRAERVRVRLEGSETSARLEVTHTPRSHFRATIKVPAICDMVVRLSAGELRIGAIRGNKNLRLRAGSLELKVGDTRDYAHVEAAVTAGELDARAFQVNKGGLFRSFHWTGTGKYDLQARLTAGELVLAE